MRKRENTTKSNNGYLEKKVAVIQKDTSAMEKNQAPVKS